MARLICVLLMLVLAAVPAAAQWTNKPSGAQTVVDCPLSGTTCNLRNDYPSNTPLFATFSTAPISPPSVWDTVLPANATSGGGQWGYYLPNVREVYYGAIWSTNADFQGTFVQSNKMLFVLGPGNNNLLAWYGGQDAPKQLVYVFQQTDGANNCHLSTYSSPGCTLGSSWGPGTGFLFPNGSSVGAFTAGSGWRRIEVYMRASTSTTSRDGILKIWVDGAVHTDYTNVNISPQGFTDFQVNYAWDGSEAFQCTRRDCSRSWHHYWDHLILATCSGCTVPTGGGTTPPPPPLPPLGVSSLRFGS